MSKLIDQFGRAHSYLRISVTDRCNLRCSYCMPPGGIELKPKADILTLEEIVRVARVFVDLGVDKIRITGGEPLVRKDIEWLVAQLGALPIKTLALTTNAVLLRDKVPALKAGGLDAINISLDTLRRERFIQIALRDEFEQVWQGIEAALAAKFRSLKINMVVMAGGNDDEIIDFVERFKDQPVNVRFIEYMPFKDNRWHQDAVFSYADTRAIVESRFTLKPIDCEAGAVAKDFAVDGHVGTVSFISSMTDSFCSSCNRLRLMSDGSIKSCLFYAPEVNLREQLRAGASDRELHELINVALAKKPEAHPPMEELSAMENRAMVEIGG